MPFLLLYIIKRKCVLCTCPDVVFVLQTKVEVDRVCASVGKKAGPDMGIKLRLRGSSLSLAHRKDFAQLMQGIMGDGPLDINPKEFSGFQLAVLNKVHLMRAHTHVYSLIHSTSYSSVL